MAAPQVRIVGTGADWTVYVDGKLLPVVSARLKLDAGKLPTVLLEVDDVEVDVLGELRAAVAARRPTRFGDSRDEIVSLLEQDVSVAAVAQRLILPRNDVLEVQAQLRREQAARMDDVDQAYAARVAAEPVTVAAPVEDVVHVEIPTDRAPEPTTIRAWARSQGLMCASIGAVPNRVLDAFYSAHPDVPRAERRSSWGGAKTTLPAGVGTATIRAWARDSGLVVPDRGALSQRIIDAYDAAHADTRPVVAL